MKRILLTLFTSFTCLLATPNIPWSMNPPGDIVAEDAPMFICFGWDDNAYADGIKWFVDFTDTLRNGDGSAVRSTYFLTSKYGVEGGVAKNQTVDGIRAAWRDAYTKGNEIGNHTEAHIKDMAGATAEAYWEDAIVNCNTFLTTILGIPREEIVGFRAPFLAYGNATMETLKKHGFRYDCSIEAGFDWFSVQEGYSDPELGWIADIAYSPSKAGGMKSLWWPYTLDNGPAKGATAKTNVKIAGFWEIMVYVYHIAKEEINDFENVPDELKVKATTSGFDYNTWSDDLIETKEDLLNTLKLEFHQRYKSNRSPLTVNAHTDYYSENYDPSKYKVKDHLARRWAIEEFIKYVLQFDDVRIVPYNIMLDWMENPIKSDLYVAPTKGGGSTVVSKKKQIQTKNITLFQAANGILKLTIPTSGTYTVTLHSLDGRALKPVYSGSLNAGVNSLSIDNKSFASGLYCLRVSGAATGVTKFVIK